MGGKPGSMVALVTPMKPDGAIDEQQVSGWRGGVRTCLLTYLRAYLLSLACSLPAPTLLIRTHTNHQPTSSNTRFNMRHRNQTPNLERLINQRQDRWKLTRMNRTTAHTPPHRQLRDILKWHVASETDGVVVLGTTGEVGQWVGEA